MKKPSISIIIPTFNGQHLLKKHLPAVIKHSPPGTQIIVVDDGGSDDTATFLKKNYPKIKLLRNSTNLGFVKSINKGVAASTADLVVLLNNDVHPGPDFIKNSLDHFNNPQLFAVTFHEDSSSYPHLSFTQGKLNFIKTKPTSRPHYSAWASGGSSIIRRKFWQQLKGFNPVYSPGYYEDFDISWRAWQQGLLIIWEPKAKVSHQHESTFKTLDPNFINNLRQRNELLFHWFNLTDPRFILSHLGFLITHTLRHPGYIKIIVRALPHLPAVIRYHLNHHQFYMSDRELISVVNRFVE